MSKGYDKLIKLIVKYIRKYIFPPIEFYNKSYKYYISWTFQLIIIIFFIFMMTRGLYIPTEYHFIETCNGYPIECFIDENFKLFYKDYEKICNENKFKLNWNISEDLNNTLPLDDIGWLGLMKFGILETVIGAVVGISVIVGVFPSIFTNLLAINATGGSPAWLSTVLPIVVAAGVLYLVYDLFMKNRGK